MTSGFPHLDALFRFRTRDEAARALIEAIDHEDKTEADHQRIFRIRNWIKGYDDREKSGDADHKAATATYHPSVDHLLQFFSFGHLPLEKAVVSKQFFDLAYTLADTLPQNAETTVALRKLLEAKDAAVRATFAR